MTEAQQSDPSTDTDTDTDGLVQREAAAQSATMAAALLRPELTGNGAEGSFAAATPGSSTRAEEGPSPKRSASARSADAPQASRGERFRSRELSDFPVPTGREEEWRFTPVARLRGLHDGTAVLGGQGVVEVRAAAQVRTETVGRDDPRLGSTGAPGDRVSAQAWAEIEKAVVLTVPRDVVTTEPTVVSVRGQGSTGAAYGHLLVDVEPFASAVVVLDYGGSATYADNIELRVGDGARLTFVAVHDWSPDTVHLTQHSALIGRDARLKSVVVTLGGELVRVAPAVTYAGPGGDAELIGVYYAGAGQHLEHRLFVDHSVPHCRSNVLYKGALQGEGARTVWVGDVLIRAAAEGTDTYELNRNLVLTDGARADSVPNLEIETGEIVGAGHASTTGRFDDEQLFYLQSRGIPEEEARRLVVRGFFAELVAQIGVPEIEERLLAEIEGQLAEAGT